MPTRLRLLIIAILTILACENVIAAQSPVTLKLEPDIREIHVGMGSQEIMITVQADQNLQFTWHLSGPGKLEGDPASPGRLYIPPDTLNEPSAEAVITVTITNAEGKKTSTQFVTFTLRKEMLTPTQPSFSIDDLKQQAQMEQAFKEVQTFEQQNISADLKRKAWERFLNAFAKDDPASSRDNDLRKQAKDRIAFWQEQTNLTPTPTAISTPTPIALPTLKPTVIPIPKPTATSRPKTWTDPVTGIEFIGIKKGCFQMGSPANEAGRYSNEGPVHQVCINGFYLGKYEVTQAQWQQIRGNNPSGFKGQNRPVENVSWGDTQKFIESLNGRTGQTFRLPTEAEWEYAARAGSQTAYSFGNDSGKLGDYAWYSDNSGNSTYPVGQKRPNPWGLYDMYGNVWEWVVDWYGTYSSDPIKNPHGPLSGSDRVLRGGSWRYGAGGGRAADRDGHAPDYRDDDVGFRLVRMP